jgi:hypothetical protein
MVVPVTLDEGERDPRLARVNEAHSDQLLRDLCRTNPRRLRPRGERCGSRRR